MKDEALKLDLRGMPLLDDYPAFASWVINNTAHSLKLSTFLLNLDPRQDHELRVRRLVRALCDAAWRKVRVQVMLGVPAGIRQRRSNTVAGLYLRSRAIEVRNLRSRNHHLKFLIADEKWSIIGSHNWTPPALGMNLEASMFIADSATSRTLSDMFRSLWSDSEPLSSDDHGTWDDDAR